MTERGYMVASLHDPEMVDKDGLAHFIYPGVRKHGRSVMGYPTPARRKAKRMMPRADRLRQQRKRKVDHSWMGELLKRFERDEQLREVKAILAQLAADGEIIKNSDGTYQSKPSLERTMLARRERMRTYVS